MLPETLERRFNGPVPRALTVGAAVEEALLRRRQALARARALSRAAARARADVAHLRRHAATSPALSRCTDRLEWARAEAEHWRRRAL